MSSLSLSLLCTLFSILINLRHRLAISQPSFVGDNCSQIYYNTTNIPFGANLNLLLSYLSSNASLSTNNGFYNSTTGHSIDQYVYGSFLCRGDVTHKTCQNCVQTAAKEIKQLCPVDQEAFLWYEECMLRYSYSPQYSDPLYCYLPVVINSESRNMSDPNGFYQTLGNLMDSLATRAAYSTSSSRILYFATGEANFTRFHKIYGLLQCSPDLSPSNCFSCLIAAIAQIPFSLNNISGAGIYYSSCVVRYSDFPFYTLINATASAPPLPEKRTSIRKRSHSPHIVVILTVPTVVILILLCIMCFFYVQRKTHKPNVNLMDEIKTTESLQFSFSTITVATNNFSDTNKLGVGGFGVVYKGTLPDGQEMAVKRLSKNSIQGEVEFKNEVELVAKLQHRNLVRLLGFCLEGEEKQLIYEFVPNKSLDYFLFDPMKRVDLDWERRYRIIEGIARGLLYLHEDSQYRIIHRDLKPSNILLDTEMNPKISDFGMARLVLMDQTRYKTNKIVGTFGYMPPEYAVRGLFSVKSDAFSFGVILLEIVSGKRMSSFCLTDNSETKTLLEYAWRLWHDGNGLEFIDTSLKDSCAMTEVLKCFLIGLLCVQEDAMYRPTMSAVVIMLKKRLDALPQPRQPAFLIGKSNVQSEVSSTSTKTSSVNMVTLSRFSAR